MFTEALSAALYGPSPEGRRLRQPASMIFSTFAAVGTFLNMSERPRVPLFTRSSANTLRNRILCIAIGALCEQSTGFSTGGWARWTACGPLAAPCALRALTCSDPPNTPTGSCTPRPPTPERKLVGGVDFGPNGSSWAALGRAPPKQARLTLRQHVSNS